MCFRKHPHQPEMKLVVPCLVSMSEAVKKEFSSIIFFVFSNWFNNESCKTVEKVTDLGIHACPGQEGANSRSVSRWDYWGVFCPKLGNRRSSLQGWKIPCQMNDRKKGSHKTQGRLVEPGKLPSFRVQISSRWITSNFIWLIGDPFTENMFQVWRTMQTFSPILFCLLFDFLFFLLYEIIQQNFTTK